MRRQYFGAAGVCEIKREVKRMSLRRIKSGTDGSVKECKGLKRKFAAYAGLAFGLILTAGLFAGCGKKDTAESGNVDVDLSIFAAKSLNSVMDEICAAYTKEHPNVNFQNNYDSSGTLMAQIKEGAKCNIFFSAGVAQMDELTSICVPTPRGALPFFFMMVHSMYFSSGECVTDAQCPATSVSASSTSLST